MSRRPALYYRAKAHRDLGQSAASRDGMRQVADGGGRLAPDAARGLAHLARTAGDFPTALPTARTLGWPGRGQRVLGDIHFAHGDMTQAATAYTAARTEAGTPTPANKPSPRPTSPSPLHSPPPPAPTGRSPTPNSSWPDSTNAPPP
ncbi:hypothetical protein ACFV8T_37795 [Streptomyces sp. NPDC059832]|uniref:hypothetical protein n=1 Tax=Streptomyces sp. NPDC059832 TaxID=3346966 RepID=UPI003650983E